GGPAAGGLPLRSRLPHRRTLIGGAWPLRTTSKDQMAARIERGAAASAGQRHSSNWVAGAQDRATKAASAIKSVQSRAVSNGGAASGRDDPGRRVHFDTGG